VLLQGQHAAWQRTVRPCAIAMAYWLACQQECLAALTITLDVPVHSMRCMACTVYSSSTGCRMHAAAVQAVGCMLSNGFTGLV
jgi:hypothetical protein